MPLTADEIDRVDDAPVAPYAVPEWGGEVLIRVLTLAEKEEFEASQRQLQEDDKLKDIRARYVGFCLVDAQRKRLYTDDAVERLSRRNGAVVDRIFDECRTRNGLNQAAVDEAKKNSSPTPSSGSSTV
jgi:hypothetical protein